MGSIPERVLIPLEIVVCQNPPQFILENFLAMVLFLVTDVLHQGLEMARADRKRGIARLSFEVAERWRFLLGPLSRLAIEFLDQVGNRSRPSQMTGDVDMILHTSHRHERASQTEIGRAHV